MGQPKMIGLINRKQAVEHAELTGLTGDAVKQHGESHETRHSNSGVDQGIRQSPRHVPKESEA
jgi:hypothetical protein